jgi:hypothetical protein
VQKKPTTNNRKKNPNNNSFEALNHLPEAEEVENPHNTAGKDPSQHKEDQSAQEYQTPTHQANPQTHPVLRKEPEREEDTVMEMDEQDLVEIDLDRLEEALNKKDLQTLPEDQLKDLQTLAEGKRWILGGDFNMILTLEEERGEKNSWSRIAKNSRN